LTLWLAQRIGHPIRAGVVQMTEKEKYAEIYGHRVGVVARVAGMPADPKATS
jgi:hypothetical protein